MGQMKTSIDWVKTNLDGVIDSKTLNDRPLLIEKLKELIAIESEIRPLVCQSIEHLYEGEYLDGKSTLSILEIILLNTSSIESESVDSAIQLLLLLPCHQANASLPVDERITRIDTGRLANLALESRLNTVIDTSSLIPYVKLIKYAGYRSALPTLESIEKNTADSNLSKEAKEACELLRYSIRLIWEDTPADYTSTLEARSRQLKEYLNDDSLKEDEHIQALFNATKESPAQDQEDPRLMEIESLMDTGSEKLKLAAAFSICRILNPGQSLYKKALMELTSLAMFAGSAGLCIESNAILEEIEIQYPQTSIYIELEKQKVNEAFVKRFRL